MKILALADRKIEANLIDVIKEHDIDIVLLLGDLKYIEIMDLEESPVPVIGVLGNHCKFDYFEKIKGINCHLKSITHQNFSFFGYQGCPYYKGGEFESTQEDCLTAIKDQGVKADVLLAHSPASGINSSETPHEGFEGLMEYIKEHSPKLFFHGHSYPPEDQKISTYENTMIIYVSGMKIFDLDDLKPFDHYPKAKPY